MSGAPFLVPVMSPASHVTPGVTMSTSSSLKQVGGKEDLSVLTAVFANILVIIL